MKQESSNEYVPTTPNPTSLDNQAVERESDIGLFTALQAYFLRGRIYERLHYLSERIESCPNDVIFNNIVFRSYGPSGPQTTNTQVGSDLLTVNEDCDISDPFSLDVRQESFTCAESTSMKLSEEAQFEAERVCFASQCDHREIAHNDDVAENRSNQSSREPVLYERNCASSKPVFQI